ncbi:MAG TPA: tetratricopeptide repeat protein [Chitinophagaceae bacterium]|nr:tetratricopeptide repeat protein [Chitinophagaceae bacterium]
MKKYTLVFISYLLPAFAVFGNAQDTSRTGLRTTTVSVVTTDSVKSGNTYALIIGINYSERKNLNPLTYAVNDAELIKNALASGSFFDSVHTDNIRMIEDKDATAAELWYGFEWLKEKTHEGDRAIIYFAGHGIAAGPALGFLIAYNAPDVPDPSAFGFQGGAIPVSQLKVIIKDLRQKKAEVYLITDACRTNEKKNQSQNNFLAIMESDEGEIQFTSCSKDQSSMEDKKWGGGHGVFTYYFVKGLSGFADDEGFKDGKVSLMELSDFVKKHVTEDSRELATSVARQIPFVRITNAPNQEQTIANANNTKMREQFKEGNLLAITKRALNADTSVLLKEYNSALEKKLFFTEEKGNAYGLLQQIRSTLSDEQYKDALQDYIINLLNDAQVRVNKYFEGVDTIYSTKFFERGARELRMALALMSKSHPLYKIYDINRLFMEAHLYRDKYATFSLAALKIDSAIALDPTLAYLYNAKGLLMLDNGSWKEALPYFMKAHDLKPDWWFPEANMIRCYFLSHDYEKITRLIRPKLGGKDSIVWFAEMANYFRRRNMIDSSSFYFSRAMKAKPDNPIYVTNLAGLYLNVGRYENALVYFKKAIAMDSSNVTLQRNLGHIYAVMLQTGKAKQIFTKILEKDPADYITLAYMGFAHYYKEEYDSALFYYEKARLLDPTNRYILENIGDSYKFGNKQDSARATYLSLLSLDPQRIDSWLNLGDYEYDQGLYDSATYYFRKALALDTANAATLRKLGEAFGDAKIPDSARYYLKKAIRNDAFDSDAWNVLGNFYYRIGKFDSAAYCYRRIMKFDPTYSAIYLNLGYVATNLSKKASRDSAAYFFKKAIAVDPYDTRSYKELANIYIDKKQPDMALKYLQSALRYYPASTSLTNEVASLFFDKDKFDSVLYYHRKVYPPDKMFNRTTVNFYYKSDAALTKYYGYVLARYREYDSLLLPMLGDQYYNKDSYDTALNYFNRFRKQFPEKVTALQLEKMATCYEELLKKETALQTYREILEMDSSSTLALYKLARDLKERSGNEEEIYKLYRAGFDHIINNSIRKGSYDWNHWSEDQAEKDSALAYLSFYLLKTKQYPSYINMYKGLINSDISSLNYGYIKYDNSDGLLKGYEKLEQADSLKLYIEWISQMNDSHKFLMKREGDSLIGINHYAEAIAVFSRAVSIDSNLHKHFSNYQSNSVGLTRLVWCYLKLNQPEIAATYLARAIADTAGMLMEDIEELYFASAGYYAVTKNNEASLRYIEYLSQMFRVTNLSDAEKKMLGALDEDPVFETVRQLPGLRSLLEKYPPEKAKSK